MRDCKESRKATLLQREQAQEAPGRLVEVHDLTRGSGAGPEALHLWKAPGDVHVVGPQVHRE